MRYVPIAHVGSGDGAHQRHQSEPHYASEHEFARIDLVRECGGDWCDEQREDAGPGRGHAGGRRRVAHEALQPLRRQHVGAKESGEGQTDRQHADGEATMTEYAQIDDGMFFMQLPDQEGGEADDGDDCQCHDFR